MCSTSSNICRLHSLQMVHMMHKATAPHKSALWWLPRLPFQQANKSHTLSWISQWNTNKQNTSDQRWHANSQWRSTWYTNSPLFLYMQHNSTIQIFHVQRLPIVKILLWQLPTWKKLLCEPSPSKYFSRERNVEGH